MLLSGIIAALTSLLIPIIILLLLLPNACYVVEQQHAVIIERLGKFNRIVNAGFHMKVPVIDRKAATVSLRTMKNGFGIDVKTQDNVTIGLVLDNQSRAFTGYLYAPAAGQAARSLSRCAAGCSRMGAVFIQYGGETYVVALFA